ncbi:NADH dehydrogenase [ubiquinone] 1 beta subcomplex subunit 11, mitochondrial [Neopsephotus bourkii]|uniref:NADH dehydrogenase [ubiquinone] 1 beta subcomplex subunit 11, mitochondrial-like n=1 Tax=Neopsephotus bourkii TaxID=309878 RepID=UPI002AA5780F|nr:NADH dehydrogenase [ubiquinone] 1 beta subcomplex subunit 11, mitochondrial-like [Neopsephotus bourkii]XP_061217710.1 NADH dehydrogenase [ubiquinone] 1 beta subcomplex subunit 11, mitochondrial [Neopsephotus bourkii]
MAALRRTLRALQAGARGRSAGVPGAVALPRGPLGADVHEEEPMAVAQRMNPDYHGFSADPVADVHNMRAVFFAGVSIAIVLGSTFLHYLPDYGLQQWARREAEIQIVERERRGLPLVDPNYYDPARLTLPPPE